LRLQVIRDYQTKTVIFEVFRQICSVFHQQLAKVARRNANARISRLSKTSKITNQESNQNSTKEHLINSNSVISFKQFPEPIIQQLKRNSPRLATSAKATPQSTSDANKCYTCGNKGYYAPQCPLKPIIGTIQPINDEPSDLDAFLKDESEKNET
jgi:hypothetical protein